MTAKDISEAKAAVARSGANTKRTMSVQQVGRGVLTPDYWWTALVYADLSTWK